MLFNSFSFGIFFIGVFFIYYFPLREKTKAQNALLLIASYFFYGFVNWKIIPILLIVTLVFYFLGLAIHRANSAGKASFFKTLGVISGVGVLLYFKYLNFFIESVESFLNSIGLHSGWSTLNIIMPIGVSFFTFKVISYVIEIYRGKMQPCADIITFSTYVAFFPTIMAGPIDRPNNFIPQLQYKREFKYNDAIEGCKRFLWGLFKKLCIADRLGLYVDAVYNNYSQHSGVTFTVTAILFAFQIYADFSGYSDMAIGIGKILGFQITENFKRPFLATNIAEFWRRMHISLTSWVTDYVFMPLNVKFRNFGALGVISAIIINMVVIGLWHGANWTYAVFGLYQGILFIPLILSGTLYNNRKQTNKKRDTHLNDIWKTLGTFLLVAFSLIIFRANNLDQAFYIIVKIFTNSGELFIDKTSLFLGILSLIPLLMKDYMDEYDIKIKTINFEHKWIQYVSITILIAYTLLFSVLDGGQFIYFQY